MGTFLGSYRLEKLSKSHGVSDKFITIGIPIQMDILCRPSLKLHFGQRLKRSRQVSSRQGKLKLSQTVQTPARYHYPPKHTRRRASGSRNKVSQSLSRNVMFFVGFVTM